MLMKFIYQIINKKFLIIRSFNVKYIINFILIFVFYILLDKLKEKLNLKIKIMDLNAEIAIQKDKIAALGWFNFFFYKNI